jgi:MFS family permease
MFPFRGLQISSITLRDMFRALGYRNYRYFFIGQSISLIGTWVQNIAMGWLVYRLTGSALLLGTIVFALQIPSLFITPFAGVLADRWNRRNTIILSQSLAMLIAFILSLLVLTDRITVGWIIVLAVCNGVILAFDTPFRQAFVPDIVTRRKDLSNAIALNSSAYNLARFIGPPIGGVLIAWVGEGWCFFINGVSFTTTIGGLLAIHISKRKITAHSGSIITQLKEGLTYAMGFKSLRYLLLLVSLSSFFGLPFQAMMPLFAADILNGNAQTLGILTGALGAGALIGALFLASRKNILKIPQLNFLAAMTFASGLAIFSVSTSIILSVTTLIITGFGMIMQFNATNTLLQSISDEDKRGRIVSLYSLTFMGITPLGSLLAGAIADYIGVPLTIFSFSLVCLVTAILFGKHVRMIFFSLARKIK